MLKQLEDILKVVEDYADCAQGWIPSAEGDYEDLKEALSRVLIKHKGKH